MEEGEGEENQGKSIKWEEWKGDGNLEEDDQDLTNWGGEEYNFQGTLYYPALFFSI